MKSLLKNVFTTLIGQFRQPEKIVFILNGHSLKNNQSISRISFVKLLKKLNKFYDFVTIENAVLNIKNNVKLDRPQISFTFDDGFSDNFIIAKILEDFNTRGCFFISPKYHINGKTNGYLDKFNFPFLTTEQILELSNSGHIIGSHTFSHVNLKNLDKSDFKLEITESRRIIEKITNKDCLFFASPYGKKIKISNELISLIEKNHKYIFWSDNRYNTFKIDDHFNRRHFEPYWNFNKVNYFLSNFK